MREKEAGSPQDGSDTAVDSDDIPRFTEDGKIEATAAASKRHPSNARNVWKFHMRPADDDEEQSWWFASTAIPLLAATLGPLANVMSIAALVTNWRNDYDPQYPGQDQYSRGFPDPKWCIALNACSLVCGFVGNGFLLFNFTRRIRYIVALPMTIILWYFATSILIAITVSMNQHVPPDRPSQTYSQGFWHAIIAAILYLISSMLLMVNMLGYFLGHYPQHFELDDEQRNLILQTMMFFIWLAGGAGVFARVCGWSFCDALYFADVTVLTVGFGDFSAPNDAGRGLILPYAVGGIIMLGLMVSSISKFAQQLGYSHVIRNHVEKRRTETFDRSVSNSMELSQRDALEARLAHGKRPEISSPVLEKERTITFSETDGPQNMTNGGIQRSSSYEKPKRTNTLRKGMKVLKRVRTRKTKLLVLKEEKDRFDAMRNIQHSTTRFKQYSGLSMSLIAFGILWCVGAVVFWQAEQKAQALSYFEALYFCYVSLLTIGYGDLAPKSNLGKPFFIVWSLVAVPTMTILISDMGDTVIASFKRGTFTLADWTVLPKEGVWRSFLEAHPRIFDWIQDKAQSRVEKKRVESGFPIGFEEGGRRGRSKDPVPTLEDLARPQELDEHDLARKLAIAIRNTADDLKKPDHSDHRYTFEEWVEYTRLIRFSRKKTRETDDEEEDLDEEEEEEGVIEWDWIGEDSPMMADQSECEWILDRLCESLDRYMRKLVPSEVKLRRRSRVEEKLIFGNGGRRSGSLSRTRMGSRDRKNSAEFGEWRHGGLHAGESQVLEDVDGEKIVEEENEDDEAISPLAEPSSPGKKNL